MPRTRRHPFLNRLVHPPFDPPSRWTSRNDPDTLAAMSIQSFDHVNIRTANLAAMIEWYADVLGLHTGPRPDFPFHGAWLYMGSQAVIHLVEVSNPPQAGGDLALEHFAFRATDMAEFRARLDERGLTYSIDPVPGFPVVQINLHDPDGNHIHIDFERAEYEG